MRLPLQPDITAIILAGGKGTRMRPYDGPKPLVPIQGRPLIFHLMDHLHRQGVRHFHVCLGHMADTVKGMVLTYPENVTSLTFSDAGPDADMGARLELAQRQLQTRHALICYGDTIAEVQVAQMKKLYSGLGAAAIFAAARIRSEFGVIRWRGDQIGEHSQLVAKIEEKPETNDWINIGFVVCWAWALAQTRRGIDVVGWLNALAKGNKVLAWRHEENHYTVNTERDLIAVQDEFTKINGRRS